MVLRRVWQLCPCALLQPGVRQGRVLGNIILNITAMPEYDALRNLLGVEGFLFGYADDVYMGGKPVQVADALTTAPDIYASVGLSID